MSPLEAEVFWRDEAERLRKEAARALNCAARCDLTADLLALDGLDLSADVCGWSAVDALAGPG